MSEDGMAVLTYSECDICGNKGQVVCFDEGMSESEICEDCLIEIYRHVMFGDTEECLLKKK